MMIRASEPPMKERRFSYGLSTPAISCSTSHPNMASAAIFIVMALFEMTYGN